MKQFWVFKDRQPPPLRPAAGWYQQWLLWVDEMRSEGEPHEILTGPFPYYLPPDACWG